ncbi:MAG: UDP-N-acetylmuramate: L-alanyl-gamma-D-glutamyl-meso-diaminopimelate ligase, partial [Kiritimatiellia bacterium]
GNVIRAVYDEARALTDGQLPYCSFPHILGELFLRNAHSTVIAGTHGKTTTSAIASWLLECGGLNPGYLVGGLMKNFERTARAGAGTHFVIEGDEYDTAFFDKQPKFLHYRPNTVVLTSVEFDHADIYRDLDHVMQSFRHLMGIMPADGCLIVRGDDPGALAISTHCPCEVQTYGPGMLWDGKVDSVDHERGVMRFTVTRAGEAIGSFESCMVGEHNLYNQVAATACAIVAGVPIDRLAEGFRTFAGIKRRQEVLASPGDVTVVDDFAHHPTAVKVTLEALRQRFGGRRLWAVWEPRSATSRRNIFQQAYAQAFDAADVVIIAAPYDQSGIAPEERFSSDALVEALTERGVDATCLPTADTIAGTIAARAHPHDVVAVLSNGSFGGLHGTLIELLQSRFDS